MDSIQQNNISMEKEYSFSDLLLAIAKNIKLVIYIPILTVIITVIYYLFVFQPSFTSSATIFPSLGEGGGNSNLLNLASRFGVSIPSQYENSDFISAEMYPKIVKSRTLGKTILFRKFDSEKFDQKTTLLTILMGSSAFDESDSSEVISNALRIINKEMLAISSDQQSPLFTLSITSHEAHLSEQIANSVIEELEMQQREFKSKNVIQKKQFIEGRIIDVKKELERTEIALKMFREQNKQISYSPALLLNQERLERDMQVQTEVFISLQQQYESVKIEEVQEASFVHILDHPNIPTKDNTSGTLLVFVGGIFGLALGIIISVFKEQHNNNHRVNKNYTEAILLLKRFFKLKK